MADFMTEFNEAPDETILDLQGLGFDVDEGVDGTVDMNGEYSLLNYITQNVSVIHELDGYYNSIFTAPEMADEQAGGILWVLMTQGFFHRVRIGATGFSIDEETEERHFQMYQIRYIEATMYYYGQLA